jgi:hypothetical protein
MVVINIYDIRAAGEGFHLIILPATRQTLLKVQLRKKLTSLFTDRIRGGIRAKKNSNFLSTEEKL